MDLDDPVCLCFRVSRRKLLAYLRTQRPKVASQLSMCGGAGTGCGWCVPYLKKLFEQQELGVTADEYARQRDGYRATGERPAGHDLASGGRQPPDSHAADTESGG